MTTKPKPRTIYRRPGWPAWARWYAVDEDGVAMVYDSKPPLSDNGPWFKYRHSAGHPAFVVGPVSYRPDWRASLRRVVGRGK